MGKKSVSFWENGAGFGRSEGFEQGGGGRHNDGHGSGAGRRSSVEAGEAAPEKGGSASKGGEPGLVAVPSDTLSDEAIEELKFMIEEEKLAGDLYEVFYATYGLNIFANIGASEDRHFDAVSNYAEKVGVDVDAFVFETVGEFSNPELQEMYDTLLEQGMDSLTGALEVGVAIEQKDIVDIAAAAEEVQGTALADIYQNLLQGSYAHLDAFEGLLG